jgi:hypothetical protein
MTAPRIADMCREIRAAEAKSYGRPISLAAHTRVLAKLREAEASRHAWRAPGRLAVAAAIGLAILTVSARIPPATPAPRSALASGYDSSVFDELGDGGDALAADLAAESMPGGPRILP